MRLSAMRNYVRFLILLALVAPIASATVELGPSSVGSGGGDLVSTNNLSDVSSPSTARANLSAAKSGANSDITSLASPICGTEGSFEFCFDGTPTANRTLTTPDASGTILLDVAPLCVTSGSFEFCLDGTLTDNRALTIPDANAALATVPSAGAVYSDGSALQSEAQLALTRGGTAKSLTAVNGGVAYSDANSLELTAAGSPGQVLTSNGAAAPTWEDAAGTTGCFTQGSFEYCLDGSANTAGRTYTLPDANGTLALTSNITQPTFTRRTTTTPTSAECNVTCDTNEIVTGGGCNNSSGSIGLQASYPEADDKWTCAYLTALGDCIAWAVCRLP